MKSLPSKVETPSRGYHCWAEVLPGEGGATPYPSIYNFWQKRYPFRIPSSDKWYPFRIPSLELCIPFNCCNCSVFEMGINHKTRMFSRIHSHKIHHLALLGFLQRERHTSLPFDIPLAHLVKSSGALPDDTKNGCVAD